MNTRIVSRALNWISLNPQSCPMEKLYNKYRHYTMVPKSAYISNLRLASRQKTVAGCVIECGVWKGGMIAGMADVLGNGRDYVLFDSFEGLPPAKPVDGAAALNWQSDKQGPNYHNNCTASHSDAEVAMQLSKATKTQIVKGWFDQTLPAYRPPAPISVLRLDGDWYESTMLCLQHLYKHMAKGGVIIIDDYYTWDGCSSAVHDFLAGEKLPLRIQQLDNDVCFLMVA
jgi:O-methyltransferase